MVASTDGQHGVDGSDNRTASSRLAARPPERLPSTPLPVPELRRTWFDIAKHYTGSRMKRILGFLKDRLKEGSTWVATSILVALGVSGDVANNSIDLIVAALSFLIAVLPDKQHEPKGEG